MSHGLPDLASPDGKTPAPAVYRTLLDRLETARTRALTSARHSTTDEAKLVASGIASGYLHAIADVVFVYEGAEAAQAYVQRAVGEETQDGARPSAPPV